MYFLMAAQAMATATKPDPNRTISGDALAVVDNCGAWVCPCLPSLLATARGNWPGREDVCVPAGNASPEGSPRALDTNASPHADTASPIQIALLLITFVPS
jgi:hypothetical protein